MSKETSVDYNTKAGFLTRSEIKSVAKGDGGAIDTLMSNVLYYLQNEFGLIEYSTEAGESVNFYSYFPFEDTVLPSVVLEPTNSKIDINWVGGVGFVQEGLPKHTVRGEVDITFDVMARNEREKYSISGTLLNVLFRGMFDAKLSKSGIKHIKFKRSINRGFDQADRVLQFHSHGISSDLLFRELVTFTFIFDWIITYPTETYNDNFINEIDTSTDETTLTITTDIKWLPITFTFT